ncbi:hypothetical protein DNTS_032594, partial [Danionella cerebrum]
FASIKDFVPVRAESCLGVIAMGTLSITAVALLTHDKHMERERERERPLTHSPSLNWCKALDVNASSTNASTLACGTQRTDHTDSAHFNLNPPIIF